MRVHHQPLQWPGLQDITAHVNFTQVAEAAFAAGFAILGYTPQSAFLLGNKIIELSASTDPKIQFNTQQQLKQLLLPTEMGETFQCLALGKESHPYLSGFQLDQLSKL